MKCIGCYERAPAPRSRFCTMRCAADWAENMNESQAWCSVCKEWNEPYSLLGGRYGCINDHKVMFR